VDSARDLAEIQPGGILDVEEVVGQLKRDADALAGSRFFAAARARLLSTDLRSDAPKAPADASVIALETDEGLAYPGFQFDVFVSL